MIIQVEGEHNGLPRVGVKDICKSALKCGLMY